MRTLPPDSGRDPRLSEPGRAQAVPRAQGVTLGDHRAQQRPHPQRVRRAHQQVRRGRAVYKLNAVDPELDRALVASLAPAK